MLTDNQTLEKNWDTFYGPIIWNSLYLAVYLPIYLSVYLPRYLPVYLTLYSPVYLPVHAINKSAAGDWKLEWLNGVVFFKKV